MIPIYARASATFPSIAERLAPWADAEARDRLGAILQCIDDAVQVFDADGTLVFCNGMADRLSALPVGPLEGLSLGSVASRMGLLDARGAEFPVPILTRALRGEAVSRELGNYRGGDGAERWLMAGATPVLGPDGKVRMAVLTVQDLTELKRAEQALQRSENLLRHAQKMEAVGSLAGGVAHDFNNLLTAINGYASVLLEMVPPGDDKREAIEEIQRAGEKAATLTNQLLVFSRRQMAAPKIVDLNKVVSEMDKLLQRLIGEHLELVCSLDANLGRIKADQGQLEQVIMNLAVNARDAMPNGGRLEIRTTRMELAAGDARRVGQGLPAGSYAVLTVSDTGMGMEAGQVARIFEPFYTTKEPGKGTGLGLAMVFTIVEQSGGRIEVDSHPGDGSSFRIWLPSLPEGEEALPSIPEEKGYAGLGGTETVLLAEDDAFVRRFVGQVLQRAGYRVLEADRGEAALRVLAAESKAPDLLLTDMVMAGMTGSQLAEKAVKERPGLKVIFMSGYTGDATALKGIQDSSVAFLQKPFSPLRLLQKLRETLGARAA